jgi:hypothetical protein
MIRLLDDMPQGVVGLEAVDDVERADYENVIVPAVEAAIAEHGKVRLVYVLGHDFDEYESDAVWEDVKPAMKVFSVLWPGQARAFPLAELDAAKRWASEGADRA